MLFLETIDHNFMDAEDIAKNFFTMNRNEAIEIVKNNWPNNDFTQLRNALETLIPELRANEDERIKMDILEALRYGLACEESVLMPGATTTLKEAIAYLERQKEQKAEIKYVYPIFKIGDTIKPKAYNESHRINKIKDDNYVLDNGFTFPIAGQDVWEIVEQKPAEKISVSEELYEHIRNACACIEDAMSSDTLCDMTDYLEMADSSAQKAFDMVERSVVKQPAEWSEEDEKCIKDIVNCLEYLEKEDTERQYNGDRNVNPKRYTGMIAKLKSLRPQPKQESVAERFARIVRENLIGIDKEVQQKFEQLYFEVTGNKMYGGYND